jgi:hypothetical protein
MIAVPPGLDPLAMTVQPMSVRTDYQLSARGHRFVGTLRKAEVIDTGWHDSAAAAAQAYGVALGLLAADRAQRYTS